MQINIIHIGTMMYLMMSITCADKPMEKRTKSWKDKSVMDMTDADMERLLDQWEKDDDPLEPDELPEHLRPAPKIDMSQIDTSNPDNLLKITKQGKGVMMFVNINADVSVEQADVAMKIWQTSLQNNHIIAERYPIEPRRSVFLFREGSQAVDAKNYLLEQSELDHVMIEGQTFRGRHHSTQKKAERKGKVDGGKDNKRTEL